MKNLDRLLARVAQPSFVLRIAALALCLLELGSTIATLAGFRTEPYDGVLTTLYVRMGGDAHDRIVAVVGFALLCIIAWAFWRLARESSMDQPPPQALRRIILLDLVAMLVTPALTILVTALAAVLLRMRPAFLFAIAQVLAQAALNWTLIDNLSWDPGSMDPPRWVAILNSLMWMLALHGMAFGLGRMAAAEAEKRRWMQAMLAERLSGERLQAEQLRYAERMVMARELHDVMGHHLTALNLQLQLSSALLKREDGAGAELALGKARISAEHLLADVRAAVSRERQFHRIDLSDALKALAEGIASSRIELDVDEAARDLSPRAAHALLRCVQESVTNAVRHARAAKVQVRLWVESTDRQEWVRVTVEDNGLGAQNVEAGNGLKGMHERMQELGGEMRILRQAPGFMIELSCPRTA